MSCKDLKYNKSISLVVPVFNEEEIVEESINIFTDLLFSICSDFEIIVIEDGSTDTTYNILKRISLENKKVKVFSNNRNLGSGISLWRGFKKATKELILTNFADRPFDLKDLRLILPLFNQPEVDFVIVVRKNRKANNLFRKITSYVNFLLIRFLFRINVKDFQFVQICKKDIINEIDLDSTGTFVSPELIIKLIKKGYRYKEVFCDFHKRPKGKSKCGKLTEYATTLKEMIRFRIALT